MKKILKLLGLGALALALAAVMSGHVQARINADDAGCWGAGAYEVCLTSAGVLAPSTTGGGSLGSSSLKWLDVETSNVNSGGAAVSVGGALTAASSVVMGVAPHKSTMTATGIFMPPNWTLAQIQAYTPAASELGGLVVCVNCASAYAICQSTGAQIQGFRAGVTGTTECK
jgi:hypothetical protein